MTLGNANCHHKCLVHFVAHDAPNQATATVRHLTLLRYNWRRVRARALRSACAQCLCGQYASGWGLLGGWLTRRYEGGTVLRVSTRYYRVGPGFPSPGVLRTSLYNLLAGNGVSPLDKLGLDGHLEPCQAQCFARSRFIDAGHLEQDTTRLDNTYPVIHRTLTFTHAGFGRLGGHGLIREYANPDTPTPLDIADDGTSGSFDLALRDPGRFKRLETELAKLYVRAAQGFTRHTAAHLLAVFYPLWHQHNGQSLTLLADINVGSFGHFFFFIRLLARINPNLHADTPIGCQGFSRAVVAHGAQGIAWDAAFDLPLTAGHFRPRQTPAGLNFDAQGTLAHGLRNSALHCTAVPDAALKLTHDVFSNKLRIQVGLLNFLNLNLDLFVGHGFESSPNLLNRIALAPDDDARLGSEDGDDHLLRIALDLNL